MKIKTVQCLGGKKNAVKAKNIGQVVAAVNMMSMLLINKFLLYNIDIMLKDLRILTRE